MRCVQWKEELDSLLLLILMEYRQYLWVVSRDSGAGGRGLWGCGFITPGSANTSDRHSRVVNWEYLGRSSVVVAQLLLLLPTT